MRREPPPARRAGGAARLPAPPPPPHRSLPPRPDPAPPARAGAPHPSRRTGTPGPLPGSGSRLCRTSTGANAARCLRPPVTAAGWATSRDEPLRPRNNCRNFPSSPAAPLRPPAPAALRSPPLPSRRLTGSAAAAAASCAPRLRAATGTVRYGSVRSAPSGAVRYGTARCYRLLPAAPRRANPGPELSLRPVDSPGSQWEPPRPGAAPRPAAPVHAGRSAPRNTSPSRGTRVPV